MALISHLIDYASGADFLYQLCTTILVFIVIRLYLFIRTRQRRFKLFKYYNIPGPETDIIGGNFKQYKQDAAHFNVDVSFHKKFGKTFGVFIGDQPSIITTDLEILRKVFLDGSKSFKERTKLFIESPLTNSVLFARHNRWKVMRKAMSPSFSSYQMRGDEKVQFIEVSIRMMLDYIERKIKTMETDELKNDVNFRKTGSKIALDIQDLMKATALHMISSMAIKLPNVQVKEEEEHVKSLDAFLSLADKGAIEYAIQFPFISSLLSFIALHFEYNKTVALIHKGLENTIDDGLKKLSKSKEQKYLQQTTNDQEVLIDHMIKLHKEGKLTRSEVLANADAILFAGYDTTSTTLTYVFWALGTYIEIQDKLREDLKTYGVDSLYLDQVLNETMRLYPTVTSFAKRLATETVQIDDLTIPQGAEIVFHGWLVHRNPEIWPDPTRYDPDRFKLAGQASKIHPCAFAPFGLGDRKCLGYQLAKLELKMVVCDLLLRYKIRVASPQVLDLVSYANVLTKPRERVMLELTHYQ